MGRKATGSVYSCGGQLYARVRVAGKRESFALPTCTAEEKAQERAALLAELATSLQRVEHVSRNVALGLLERAASRDGKALADVVNATKALCAGQVPLGQPTSPNAALTFGELGRLWTSGELARDYRDHVRVKRTASYDISRLERYVYPVVQDVPVT